MVKGGQSTPDPEALEKRLRATQLIAGALIMGQVTFAAIVPFIELGEVGEGLEMLFLGGAVFGVAMIPMAWLIRHLVWKRGRDHGGAAELAAVQAGTIAHFAMLEGAALLNIICWMLKGSAVPNVPIIVLVLGAQVFSFPRREHFAPRESY